MWGLNIGRTFPWTGARLEGGENDVQDANGKDYRGASGGGESGTGHAHRPGHRSDVDAGRHRHYGLVTIRGAGGPQVRTERSVSYVDHNMLQTTYRNADDHRYLQSVAAKYGAYFSRPGNGICHQVHLERFAEPR